MESKYKITITDPCQENWDKMTPNENGRFCMICSKTVVDFTKMLPDEIQHFFTQNKNKSICGRFKNAQLETITVQIPSRVLYTQTHYHKMFLLALFIAMGTTLFSCQDKDGQKKKIGKVEVVTNNSSAEHIVVGKSKINSNQTVVPPPPPPKVDQVKFVIPSNSIQNVNHSKTKSASLKKPISEIKTDSVKYDDSYLTGVVLLSNSAPYPADYPGGQNKFYTVFKRNFIIPEKASGLEGELELSFDINKLGRPDNIKVLKDLGNGMAEEGIRVLGSMAKWMPANLNGKAISSSYIVKLTFEHITDLNESKTKELNSQIASIKLTPELQ